MAQLLHGLNLQLNIQWGLQQEKSCKKRISFKKGQFYILQQKALSMRGFQNCYEGKASYEGNQSYLSIPSPHPNLPRRFYLKHQRLNIACIFQMFWYANNTTSDGLSAIPRPFYNRYFGHITIKKSGLRFALRPSENAFSRILCFWEHLPL